MENENEADKRRVATKLLDDLSVPFPAPKENQMSTITLKRTGDTPLQFEGTELASVTGDYHSGRQVNRWFDLRLYRDAGSTLYVAHVHYNTRWQGETDRYDAQSGSAADVAAWLRWYDPQNCIEGFPPGEPYRERQERLMRDILDRYEHRVSELLTATAAMDSDFASKPEAETFPYSEMDRHAILSWVSAQLMSFPLSMSEACAICDANNGAMLMDYCWMGIDANIVDTPASALSEKWSVDALALAKRIHDLDRGTLFALAYAISQFWRSENQDHETALIAAGFHLSRKDEAR